MRRSTHSLFASGCVVAVLGVASADPTSLVDAASQRIERAEFHEALAALERAESRGSLGRSEVLRVLELKALVFLALGRRQEAEAVLTTLATFAPDHRFPPHTSPDLVTAFDFARGQAPATPELEIRVRPSPDGVKLTPQLSGDRSNVVQRLRLAYRVNAGRWTWSAEPSANVAVGPGDRVDFLAQGLGKEGVLLETSVDRYRVPSDRKEPERRGLSPWWFVAGGVVVVTAVTVGAVLLSGSTSRTQPSAPTLERP